MYMYIYIYILDIVYHSSSIERSIHTIGFLLMGWWVSNSTFFIFILHLDHGLLAPAAQKHECQMFANEP